jgi:hypothetical protein
MKIESWALKKLCNYWAVWVVAILFVACNGNEGKSDKDDRTTLEETVVVSPSNLEAYFDSLVRNTPAFIYVRNSSNTLPNPDSLKVWESIKALDNYQSHRIKTYPLDIVGKALGSLIFSQWHNDTHGDGEDEVMEWSEQFFFRYLEQVARLCPHVDYLTSIHTGNDMAGIFTGNKFSSVHQSYYCILLYRYGSGYRTKFLQHYVGYDKIWELSDSVGRHYLLCYNGQSDVQYNDFLFKAILFMKEGDDYNEVCAWKDKEFDEYSNDIECCLDYNPRTLTWTKCRREGDKRIPIPGLKRLHLLLDGRRSSFVVE